MVLMMVVLLSGFLFFAVASFDERKGCGFEQRTEEEHAAIDAEANKYIATAGSDSRNAEIIVNVYWHVLTNASGSGDYGDAVVSKSIEILNSAFGGIESSYPECSSNDQSFTYESFPSSPFKFLLKRIDRVKSDNAYYLDYSESLAHREAYRIGDCSDLNIFTGESNYLGSASFPFDCPIEGDYQNPKKKDSVLLDYGTLPDGFLLSHNEGDNAVHQVGHWLGLLHTFNGGCDRNKGDRVSDTPREASPAYGCPISRDTCRSKGPCRFRGYDPIHNFMDYTSDCCKFRFTEGQIERMIGHVGAYRGLGTGDISDDDNYEYQLGIGFGFIEKILDFFGYILSHLFFN